MATMYGRGRGKAGSHPPKPEKPLWIKLSDKEIEEIVVKISKQGSSPAKIGLVLRDNYGIPSTKTVLGKKIQKILDEHGIKAESHDMISLEKRITSLKKHIEKNRKDQTAIRGLQIKKEKVRRLEKYNKKRAKK